MDENLMQLAPVEGVAPASSGTPARDATASTSQAASTGPDAFFRCKAAPGGEAGRTLAGALPGGGTTRREERQKVRVEELVALTDTI